MKEAPERLSGIDMFLRYEGEARVLVLRGRGVDGQLVEHVLKGGQWDLIKLMVRCKFLLFVVAVRRFFRFND